MIKKYRMMKYLWEQTKALHVSVYLWSHSLSFYCPLLNLHLLLLFPSSLTHLNITCHHMLLCYDCDLCRSSYNLQSVGSFSLNKHVFFLFMHVFVFLIIFSDSNDWISLKCFSFHLSLFLIISRNVL